MSKGKMMRFEDNAKTSAVVDDDRLSAIYESTDARVSDRGF